MIETLGSVVRSARRAKLVIKERWRDFSQRIFPWQAEMGRSRRRWIFLASCLLYLAAAFFLPATIGAVLVGIVTLGCCWTILDWIGVESRKLKLTSLADTQDSDHSYNETSIDFLLAAFVLVLASPVMLSTAQSFGLVFSGAQSSHASLAEFSAMTAKAFFGSLTLDFTEDFNSLQPWLDDFGVVAAVPVTGAAKGLSFLVKVSFDLLIIAGLALLLRSILAVREASRLLTYDHRPAAGMKSRMKRALRRALKSSDERRVRNAALAIQENGFLDFFEDLKDAASRVHGVRSRITCLDALVGLHGDGAVPVLLETVRRDNWAPVRMHSILQLHPLLDDFDEFRDDAIRVVSHALDDNAPAVRAAAIEFILSVPNAVSEHGDIQEKLMHLKQTESFDVVKTALSRQLVSKEYLPAIAG